MPLTSITDTSDLAAAPIGEITTHIVETHHEYLRKLLPRLAFLVNKIRDVHGGHHPELQEVAEVFSGFVQEMEEHLDQQESHFFRRCEELAEGATDDLRTFFQEAIAAQTAKRENLINAFQVMRRLTGDFEVPADSCSTYQMTFDKLVELEADTQSHLHKEADILVERVKALL